jgi:hypothetical protein
VKAAMALGYLLDPASLEKLSLLVNDPVLEVRLAALRALSFRRSPERLEIIKKAVANDAVSAAEKIMALSALSRAEGLAPPEAAAKYVDALFRALESDLENPDTELLALREIGSLAPHDERIKKKVVEILSKGPPPKHPKRIELLFASIGLLNRSCFTNRAELIEAVLAREGDPRLRNAFLSQALFLEKTRALAIIDKEALRNKDDKRLAIQIKNLKERLETLKAPPNPCEPRKKPPPPPRKPPPPRNK